MLQAAAAAAEQAEAAAQAGAQQAGQAEQAAQAVAQALLVSKRAEIEAADMLEKPKNPKDADPAAADLLKVSHLTSCWPSVYCTCHNMLRRLKIWTAWHVCPHEVLGSQYAGPTAQLFAACLQAQSAEKCAAQLKLARAAAADAKAAAGAAASAAADASKAVQQAQPSNDTAACAAAQAAAAAAADKAAQSGLFTVLPSWQSCQLLKTSQNAQCQSRATSHTQCLLWTAYSRCPVATHVR